MLLVRNEWKVDRECGDEEKTIWRSFVTRHGKLIHVRYVSLGSGSGKFWFGLDTVH